MEARNSTILESSGEDSMLIETVKNLVTRDNRTESETDFFLVSQMQAERYPEDESIVEASHKQRTVSTLTFTDLCRICANVNDHLIPIFEGEGAEHDLPDKILKYLPIHVSENDTLPLQLCYHCATTLLAWHELSEGCLNAERRLLEMQDTLQNKHQYYNPATLDNLEVSASITNTAVTITTCADSQPDQQTDKNTRVQENIEETEKSNRCGPRKSLAAYRTSRITARRLNNVARKHENDVTKSLTPITSNAKETSERETQNSSDNVRHEKRINSQLQETTRSTISQLADKLVKNYTCDNCHRTFKRKHHLIGHITTCKSSSINERTSNTHVKELEKKKTKKNKKIYDNLTKRQEDSNSTEVDNNNKKNRHRVSSTKSPRKRCTMYPCEYCEHVAEKRKLLNAHVIEAHPELTKRNRKSFVATETVLRARMEHDGRVYYHCTECGKNLNSPYTFYWHIRIHTGERMFTCHLCGKRFRVNQGLARHLRETHDGIKNVACDLCGRMFSTRRNVEDHRRIHTGERPYVCNVCGKTFKQKASLFVHNRTHTDVFPYKCSHCGQAFRTRPPLALHITKHTGEKPHACDVCGRRFRIKYELKRHRLIHSDEKPWCCTDCGLSFRQKRYLVNHRRLNHESPRCSTAAPDRCEVTGSEVPLQNFAQGDVGRHDVWTRQVSSDKPERSKEIDTSTARSTILNEEPPSSIFDDNLEEKVEMRTDNLTELQLDKFDERRILQKNDFDAKTHPRGNAEQSEQISEQSIRLKKAENTKRACHKCEDCGKVLSTSYNLLIHRNVHTNARPYVCSICEKSFRSASGLNRHLRDVHEGVKNFECDVCGRRLASRASRDEHRRTHADERPHVCEICGSAFKQKASLYVHRLYHSQLLPYRCDLCDRGFRRRQELVRHISGHSDWKPHTCDVCDQRFRSKGRLARHRHMHNKRRSHICTICGAGFTQERYLKRHCGTLHKETLQNSVIHQATGHEVNLKILVKESRNKINLSESSNTNPKNTLSLTNDIATDKSTKHLLYTNNISSKTDSSKSTNEETKNIKTSNFTKDSIIAPKIHTNCQKRKTKNLQTELAVEKTRECNSCPKEINEKISQQTEQPGNNFSINRLIACRFCDKKFRSRQSHRAHMRMHTNEKSYTCHVCGKQFVRGSLYYHLKHVHDGVKNHACDICGRSFAMKTVMEDHRRIHTGERPYVCDSCGKTFKTKASLYIHSRTHTDEFPHECTYCAKRFRWRQQMLAHLTVHTGEKNHTCDVCGKGFGVKNDLTRHRRIHSDEKPYTCQRCGISFSQKRYLKNHERLRVGTCSRILSRVEPNVCHRAQQAESEKLN